MSPANSILLESFERLADWGARLVIIGVAGEGVEIGLKICKRKLKCESFLKWYDRHEFSIEIWGALFWLVVVAGLGMEFGYGHKAQQIVKEENSRITQEAAGANALAGQANLQVAVLSNKTVRLSVNLEDAKSNNFALAKQVFGLATQTEQISTNIEQVRDMVNSPEVTAKLNEAKTSLTEANKTLVNVKDILTSSNLNALSNLKPKSLKERIINCLDSIDKSIVLKLESSTGPFLCSGEINHETFSELKKLADEPDALKYLKIEDNLHGSAIMSDGTIVTTDIKFWLYPALLKKE